MPTWIHNRAEHLLANNPGMPKSMAFAIATQQGHKEAGVGVGAGFTTSQYSGPLSFGPFKMVSQIPGFTAPEMTKVDEKLESKVAADRAKALAGAKALAISTGQGLALSEAAGLVNMLTEHTLPAHVDKIDAGGKVLKNLKASSPIPIAEVQGLRGASFARMKDGSNAILHGENFGNAPTLAHELGHQALDTRMLRGLQGPLAAALHSKAPILSVASGLLSGSLAKPGSKGRRLGIAAPALAAAPLLAAEAAASVIGLRRLSQAGASGSQLMQAALSSMLPGFASYALHAGTGMALAAAAQGGVDLARGVLSKKKQAAAATGAMTPAGRLMSSQRTTAPKVTGFSGPSIAEVAKPVGFGKPLPGAKKNTL